MPVRILLQASTKPNPKGAGKSNGLMDLSHGQLHELTPICTPKNVILIYVYVLSDTYVLGIFVIFIPPNHLQTHVDHQKTYQLVKSHR